MEAVTTTKTITIYPNQKHRLNAEVCALQNACHPAFRSVNAFERRVTRTNLIASIRRAEADYAIKNQGSFSTNEPHSMWRGIKKIKGYTSRDAECPSILLFPML